MPQHCVAAGAAAADLLVQTPPHGAARATGSARSRRSTPPLPDPTSTATRARGRWSVGNLSLYESVVQAIGEPHEIDLDAP